MGLTLKQLGICLAAALALSLAVTAISSAAQFTSSSYPANFSGEGVKGTWKFTTEAGSTECQSSSSAVLSEASSTLTLTSPTLSSCVTAGHASTTKIEGCDSLIHITEAFGENVFLGKADLVCPAGASILGYDNEKICEIRIPPQTGNVSLVFVNNKAKGYVESTASSSKITYNVIKDSEFCPYGGTGTKTNGELSQSSPSLLKIEGKTIVID